jgi:hypothetical protein
MNTKTARGGSKMKPANKKKKAELKVLNRPEHTREGEEEKKFGGEGPLTCSASRDA